MRRRPGAGIRRKLRSAGDAVHLRGDPDTLVAIIAEQNQLLDWFRGEVASLRAKVAGPEER